MRFTMVRTHKRRAHRRNRGLMRWLMATIATGAFVAYTFVNYLAH